MSSIGSSDDSATSNAATSTEVADDEPQLVDRSDAGVSSNEKELEEVEDVTWDQVGGSGGVILDEEEMAKQAALEAIARGEKV